LSSAQRLLTSPQADPQGMRMRQDIRQPDTGHPGLEPWGRDRRPHVPSFQPTMRKSDALLPPVSDDPARPCGLLGVPPPEIRTLSKRRGPSPRRRLRRRHMATPPAPVNRFLGPGGIFLPEALVGDRGRLILRALARRARGFRQRAERASRRPGQPVVI
jgi:hypothetical protein